MTPKSDPEEDMSMEEILASIRKFVTDNPSDSAWENGKGNPKNNSKGAHSDATQKQPGYQGDTGYGAAGLAPLPATDHVPSAAPMFLDPYQNPVVRSTLSRESGPREAGAHEAGAHEAALTDAVRASIQQSVGQAHASVQAAVQEAIPACEEDILELTSPIAHHTSTSAPHSAWTPPSRTTFQKKSLEESIMTLTNPIESKKQDIPTRVSPKPSSLFEPEENLGSSHTVSASASSLSRLAQASKTAPRRTPTLADQRGVTLDQLIQDMIRPMIKQWIDTHLPSLVEEMVAKEIKRITKHLG
jgi:cell pole-organizing protein PopZ